MKLFMILSLFVVTFATISSTDAGVISVLNTQTEPPEQGIPAPQTKPSVMHLPSIIDCGRPESIQELVVGQFQELPFVNGGTVVKRPDGVIMPALMTIYVNLETGTYSLVAKFPEVGLWCIINSGGNFKPATPSKST
jgi:hypothetical protein